MNPGNHCLGSSCDSMKNQCFSGKKRAPLHKDEALKVIYYGWGVDGTCACACASATDTPGQRGVTTEIAAELQISEPRVYQLIARAKAIGRTKKTFDVQ